MLIVAGPVGEESHLAPPRHPERPDRITSVLEGLADLRLGSDLRQIESGPAPEAALLRVHTEEHLARLRSSAGSGRGQLDPDTYVGPDSWSTARLAAGAGLATIDALRDLNDGVGFVVARPPGHHARRDQSMGFCLINNVAVAAAAIRALGERVLIIDWDVHHGNGTQEIFWNDPGVLYVSIHEWPLYPGTGRAQEVGGPNALGTNVNVPLPAGATGDVVRRAIAEIAGAAVDRFEADWVLVSCGFDAHRSDPLANLALSSADFGDLAADVHQFVPRAGRMALFLEGGYDNSALRCCVASTMGALVRQHDVAPKDGGGPEGPTSGGPGDDHLLIARERRRQAIEHQTSNQQNRGAS